MKRIYKMKRIIFGRCLDCPHFQEIGTWCTKHNRPVPNELSIPAWCKLEDN